MKKIKLLVLILPLFFITGCFNYRELNELAITSAVGIDKTDDGYKTTIQIINTQKNGADTNSSMEQPKFVTYTSTGKNLQEALRSVILESSRRIYADHIQVLVIGEELARDGIYDILDLFFRNSELRKQFQVVIARDATAEDILKVVTPLETLNSKHIDEGLSVDNKYLGVGEVVDFEQLIASYLDSNKEIVLPSIVLKEKDEDGDTIENTESTKPEENVIESTMGIFKDDKLLGFLSEKESIALSFARGKINNTVLSYECDNNKYVVSEIINTKTDVSMESDPLKAKIKITGSLNINEVTCDLDLEDLKVVSEIESSLEDELKDNITDTINTIRDEYNTDVFGFRDILYKSNPKYYKYLKDEWYDSVFKDLDIEIDVDFDFVEKGNSLKVIKR